MRTFWTIAVGWVLASLVASNAIASMLVGAPGRSEPQRLRWKTKTIKIAVSTSLTQPNFNIKTDSDVLGALRRSLATWENAADVEFQLEPTEKQSVSPTGPSGDAISLITIGQTPENVLLFSKNPQGQSAKTRIFYNRRGFITEADIVLNPFEQFSTDGTFGTFDIEATLTHEIGHLLGLRHSFVLGATMSDSLPRNGAFGALGTGPRTLAQNDTAAIRDLYGIDNDDETCCGTINGRIALASGRSGGKNLRVWAEDSSTGRVTAQVDAASDGSFSLGGMPGGTYSLFWQRRDVASPSSVGELGLVQLDKGTTRTVNEKAVLRRTELALAYIGINSQLADSAVTVSAGREYTIFLGGRGLDAASTTIDFNSRFFTVLPHSLAKQDFGDGLSVISFVVTVGDDAPAGVYSIFARGDDGVRSGLIGALSVE